MSIPCEWWCGECTASRLTFSGRYWCTCRSQGRRERESACYRWRACAWLSSENEVRRRACASQRMRRNAFSVTPQLHIKNQRQRKRENTVYRNIYSLRFQGLFCRLGLFSLLLYVCDLIFKTNFPAVERMFLEHTDVFLKRKEQTTIRPVYFFIRESRHWRNRSARISRLFSFAVHYIVFGNKQEMQIKCNAF